MILISSKFDGEGGRREKIENKEGHGEFGEHQKELRTGGAGSRMPEQTTRDIQLFAISQAAVGHLDLSSRIAG